RETQGIDFGDERFSRAVHVQTAGHLTGSEEQGGCKSLERLYSHSANKMYCGDSSRVRIRARHAWDPGANPGHRSMRRCFSVSPSAPHSGSRVQIPGAAPTLRSKAEGTPHKGNRGGSIPPVATTSHSGVFQ